MNLITIRYIIVFAFCLVSMIILNSCKKLIQIPPPVNTITTGEVFADSTDASSAILGLYTQVADATSLTTLDGSVDLYTGLSSDELTSINPDPTSTSLYANKLDETNGYLYAYFWLPSYTTLYQANACIEGIQASNGISVSAKNKFLGEAEFFRAFLYFDLINLFGDVPLLTTSNYKVNEIAARTPTQTINQAILTDLKDAESKLGSDYSISNGQRIRVNKWAVDALLARVYLYQKNYTAAIASATDLISNTSLFSLAQTPSDVFLTGSNEAILQWNINTSGNSYNATPYAAAVFPTFNGGPPTFYLDQQLLNSFEPGDLRRSIWLDSTIYYGTTYYYCDKYVIGNLQRQINTPAPQYYTPLRLAEQYLIRAEANSQLGNFGAAISDLNLIRKGRDCLIIKVLQPIKWLYSMRFTMKSKLNFLPKGIDGLILNGRDV